MQGQKVPYQNYTLYYIFWYPIEKDKCFLPAEQLNVQKILEAEMDDFYIQEVLLPPSLFSSLRVDMEGEIQV